MKEADFLKVIAQDVPPPVLSPSCLILPPPLQMEWQEAAKSSNMRADALLRLSVVGTRGKSVPFAAEYKNHWDKATLVRMVAAFRTAAPELPGEPLVIVPYLSEANLRFLEVEQVSGLDFCGNGVLLRPLGRWYLRWTGQPNRFKPTREAGLQNPYGGRASQLARLLLRVPVWENLEAARVEILRRGGVTSLPLVYQAAKRMEQDALIERQGRGVVRLLQPDALRDKLVAALKAPPPPAWQGRIPGDPAQFLPPLFAWARERNFIPILTGVASAPRWTNIAADEGVALYVPPGHAHECAQEVNGVENARFANLQLIETDDAERFFDRQTDPSGLVWASPVQTYLEMRASGDARLIQSAKALGERLGEADA